MDPRASPHLSGHVVLITGATSGIGFAAAKALAETGAKVVMVSRDPRRGESAREAISRETGSSQLEVMQADLASLDSIRSLAQRFQATHGRLDVLINDAGVFEPHRRLSPDGIEMTFAVNVVAPFLLSSLLLGCLRRSAPSRIVNVCSAMQASASLDLDDPQFERRRYRMIRAYAQSKLALLIVTKELARRLQGTEVTVNAAHPGWVATNLGNKRGPVGVSWRLMRPFMISPEQGAKTPVYLALSPDVARVSGAYFAKQSKAPSNPIADDPGLARELWDILESLVHSTVRAR